MHFTSPCHVKPDLVDINLLLLVLLHLKTNKVSICQVTESLSQQVYGRPLDLYSIQHTKKGSRECLACWFYWLTGAMAYWFAYCCSSSLLPHQPSRDLTSQAVTWNDSVSGMSVQAHEHPGQLDGVYCDSVCSAGQKPFKQANHHDFDIFLAIITCDVPFRSTIAGPSSNSSRECNAVITFPVI
jgi:hypothetical protein